MTSILSNSSSEVKVSSVLNRDVKSFGKKYLTDGKEDTCWNSDEGSPQWVLFKFPNLHRITGFKIQFQGGFVGKDCKIEVVKEEKSIIVDQFYPEDINSMQVFHLSQPLTTDNIKFVFEKSTDFFGRIVIYYIDITSDL